MTAVQITIRDIPGSPALEQLIRKKVDKLSHYCNRINSCRVVVEQSQKHKHQGKLFNVRIDLTVPGKELVVTHKVNQDIYIAIREAFNAAGRQLEEHSRKRHGRVKTHADLQHGHVARMVEKEGYGFIEGVDGNEYYFSMTNVSYPKFNQLAIGDAVEFTSKALRDGQQAHHIVKEKHNNHYLVEIDY